MKTIKNIKKNVRRFESEVFYFVDKTFGADVESIKIGKDKTIVINHGQFVGKVKVTKKGNLKVTLSSVNSTKTLKVKGFIA